MTLFKKLILSIFKVISFKFYNKILFLISNLELQKIRANYLNYKNINQAELKVFSQNGEDGIIDFLINQLKIEKPKFVEIGVNSPPFFILQKPSQ